MTKQFIAAACMGAAIISQTSCKTQPDFKKKGSIEYAIVKDEKGKNAQVGDIISFNVIIKHGDSVIADSRKDNQGKPAEMQLPQAQSPIEWYSALTEFSAGDSGIVRFSVDSIKKYNNGQIPPFMKPGKMISFEIKILSIKTQAEAQAEAKESAAKQKDVDDKILQDFFTQNNIHPSKTPGGVYYVIEKEGTGNVPNVGDEVSVMYTGKTLDGKPFDSNVDPSFKHTEPLKFPIGRGAVIPGWDEGVSVMKKGSKGKLFIPSTLAYGPQSPSPAIGANSILTFDVEVLDIKPAPAAPAGEPNQSSIPVQ